MTVAQGRSARTQSRSQQWVTDGAAPAIDILNKLGFFLSMHEALSLLCIQIHQLNPTPCDGSHSSLHWERGRDHVIERGVGLIGK